MSDVSIINFHRRGFQRSKPKTAAVFMREGRISGEESSVSIDFFFASDIIYSALIKLILFLRRYVSPIWKIDCFF